MSSDVPAAAPPASEPGGAKLKRALGLPLLVFYGVGVTVGAGIFALIGEIIGRAGDLAPLTFLVAAVLAGVSAISYAMLSRRFPRAAGAAAYANAGFGPRLARVTGIGVAITGIISSSVVALAFADYLGTLVPVPDLVLAIGILAVLTAVALAGVRESVILAAVVTVVEAGTLVLVAVVGLPELADDGLWSRILTVPSDWTSVGAVFAAVSIAFFAFIGFEDIVNMAEETKRPEKVMAPAIGITLGLTTLLYMLIAVIALAVSDRVPLAASDAPVADLYAELTGASPDPVAVVAALAMVNGILVQILMASRVLYGMSRDGLLPRWLATVHPRRRTPVPATLAVAGIIAVLILLLPLVDLAAMTSYVTLAVFAVVNFSLWRIMRRSAEPHGGRMAAWGLGAGILTVVLLAGEIARRLLG